MSTRAITANPVAAVPALWGHRALIRQLVEREIVGRYRGSILGVFWSLITPLLMLAIYTFVFGVVFQARWGDQGSGTAEFAVVLFAGLLAYSFFAEVVTRAPGTSAARQAQENVELLRPFTEGPVPAPRH